MSTTHTVTPKERPILFSGPMVQALLAGRKTQTRRVVKPQPVSHDRAEPGDSVFFGGALQRVRESRGRNKAAIGHLNAHSWNPYGVPGDRLIVRETLRWRRNEGQFTHGIQHPDEPADLVYDADGALVPNVPADYQPTREVVPSIHMPRWASRITLEVVGVRVERVQDISEADAKAEGVTVYDGGVCYRDGYSALWDEINGKGSWADNPWVWVVEFRRVNP